MFVDFLHRFVIDHINCCYFWLVKYSIGENQICEAKGYNPFLVYCRELAPSTVSLTGDRAQGDDSKHDSHYRLDNRNPW